MALSFYGIPLLEEAMQNWQSLSEFRRERTRNKNYTFGRQWCDVISVNGRRMTEYDYIVSEGSLPLKNNLIRRIVRNVVGVFRRQLAEKIEGWSESLQQIAAHNRMYELLSRTMEEFLISGMAVFTLLKFLLIIRNLSDEWRLTYSLSPFIIVLILISLR